MPPFGGLDVHSASSPAYSCIHTEAPHTALGGVLIGCLGRVGGRLASRAT